MTPKRRYRRGYTIAILVSFEEDHVILWHVFSRVVKKHLRLELVGRRTEKKVMYNFHESITDALKPALEEEIKSIVVTAPAKTTYTQEFMEHIQKHHKYLIQPKNLNRANFVELIGSADDRNKVTELIKTEEFIESIALTTSEEAEQIVDRLEKHLYDNEKSIILYQLKEIEDMIYTDKKSRMNRREYLLLTDKYLLESRPKNRIYRLLQISKNKRVKTKVVDTKTSAGNRINQFGGIIFFAIPLAHGIE